MLVPGVATQSFSREPVRVVLEEVGLLCPEVHFRLDVRVALD